MLRKKISAVMTVFIVILSISLNQISACAQESIDTYKLEMLQAVGILKQTSDYVGGMVTRFEGAEAVLAILGAATDSTNESSCFYDIQDYTYESAVTAAVKSYNIMDGIDGRFLPDDILTFNQAVKIILSALGYDQYAHMLGAYPQGYKKAAYEAGLFKNIQIGEDEGISQDKFYEMIYNAASIPILQPSYTQKGKIYYSNEDKQTFLEKYHDIFYVEGEVTANELTGLGGADSAGKSNVKIENKVYSEGISNAGEYIGFNVEAYVKDADDGETVIWLHPLKKCTSVLIKSDEIDIFDKPANKIQVVDEKGKTKKYSLSPVADVIYNGKYSSHPQEFQLDIQNGSVKLIDRDGDNKYDCIIISDYITYRVKNIDSERKVIFDRFLHKPISFDENDAYFKVTKNGAVSDFYEIEVDDVLLIGADKIKADNGYRTIDENAKVYDIIILDKTQNKKTENVSYDKKNGYIISGGVKYKMSEEIYDLNELGKKSKIRSGAVYNFVLDGDNKIIDYEPTDSERYGFLCRCIEDFEEDNVILQFFDLESSQMLKLPVIEKPTVNGYKNIRENVMDTFCTNSSGVLEEKLIPQLFIYRENKDGEITYIDTWIYNAEKEDPKSTLRLSVKGSDFVIKSGKYNMSNKFFMSPEARVLTVRTRKEDGVDKIVNNASSFTVSDRNVADYWETYNAEAYNCTAAGSTDMVVLYESIDYGYETETTIDGGMMYDSVSEVLYDGEICKQLNGYTPKGPISVVLEDGLSVKDWNGSGFIKVDLSALKKGDIIKFDIDNSKCMKIERIFSYSDSKDLYNEYHYYRDYRGAAQSHFSYGKAFAYETGAMCIKFDESFDRDNQNSYAVVETDGKDILVFDTVAEKFEIAEPGGLLYADTMNDFDGAYDIVFHTHDMRTDSIYAYR